MTSQTRSTSLCDIRAFSKSHVCRKHGKVAVMTPWVVSPDVLLALCCYWKYFYCVLQHITTGFCVLFFFS